DEAATVRKVVELARSVVGDSKVFYGDSFGEPHEAGWLALEVAKARLALGVTPKWALAETVNRTMAWYRAQHEGADAKMLCTDEIADYEEQTSAVPSVPWSQS
ncbi:CDP-glucose 4,6-dehydratase, partial [bacterium]|nr:CDP-glucose 4,6-dehydratase [bacterium]